MDLPEASQARIVSNHLRCLSDRLSSVQSDNSNGDNFSGWMKNYGYDIYTIFEQMEDQKEASINQSKSGGWVSID